MLSRTKRRKLITILTLCCFLISTVFAPVASFGADPAQNTRVMQAIPAFFNPVAGESTTFEWRFYQPHQTKVTVHQKNGTLVRTLVENRYYYGEETSVSLCRENWNGKDSNGQIVPDGQYYARITPLEPQWAEFAFNIPVIVSSSQTDDINIAPNLKGDLFIVHGSADMNTRNVAVSLDGNFIGNAAIYVGTGGGQWSLQVPLEDFTIHSITAVKTLTNASTVNLPPINVLKHIIYPGDTLSGIADKYYGNADYYSIIKDNNLESDTEIHVGYRLLILDPNPGTGGAPDIVFTQEYLMTLRLLGLEGLENFLTELSKDPVDLATGNYIYTHTDIEVVGSFPIEFSLIYNSLDNYTGSLGQNWHHSYDIWLQDLGTNSVEITFGDGHREQFKLDQDANFIPLPGKNKELVKTSDGYTLTLADKTQYLFNKQGQLLIIRDLNGNSTNLSYSGELLTAIETISGSLNLTYDAHSLIRTVTDQSGNQISYTYIQDGYKHYLNTFTDALGSVTQYGYDSEYLVATLTQPNGNVFVNNYFL